MVIRLIYIVWKCFQIGYIIQKSNKILFKWWDLKPFPKRQILGSSKLKVFTEDNFKFEENGRKFSIWVEISGGKGEIAGYEQFSFSHSVLKRLVLQPRKNQSLFGKGLNIGLLWNTMFTCFTFFTSVIY